MDLVARDRPPVPLRHRPLDARQVVLHVEVLLGRHLRKADAEVPVQLRLEREIRLDLVPGPRELEVLAHAGPGERHGDQDERGAALDGAGLGLVPAEHRQREVEDVDPLLLDRQAGLPKGRAQAEVERCEGQRGLKLVVGVTRGGSVRVFDRFGQEGQELPCRALPAYPFPTTPYRLSVASIVGGPNLSRLSSSRYETRTRLPASLSRSGNSTSPPGPDTCPSDIPRT